MVSTGGFLPSRDSKVGPVGSQITPLPVSPQPSQPYAGSIFPPQSEAQGHAWKGGKRYHQKCGLGIGGRQLHTEEVKLQTRSTPSSRPYPSSRWTLKSAFRRANVSVIVVCSTRNHPGLVTRLYPSGGTESGSSTGRQLTLTPQYEGCVPGSPMPGALSPRRAPEEQQRLILGLQTGSGKPHFSRPGGLRSMIMVAASLSRRSSGTSLRIKSSRSSCRGCPKTIRYTVNAWRSGSIRATSRDSGRTGEYRSIRASPVANTQWGIRPPSPPSS